MTRYLDFFEPKIVSSITKPIEDAYARGERKILVVGVRPCSRVISNCLKTLGLSWVDKNIIDFQTSDIADNTLIVLSSGTGDDVSRVLHACVESTVSVIAPVTDHHCSQRTVFLMSIPKAGTHMMIRLLDLMGLKRSSNRVPCPGTWSTPVGYEYHVPCRELLANDWSAPLGRQLLFRSPAIFVYRNPLDIVVSELEWFMKAENAFSGYLNCCADDNERLSRLITDESVMGNIRDRINRYAGWMNFGNVIPVSYEELVGSRGGGSDAQQSDSIWALQLKLHISGSPEAFGKLLYDTDSATFSKGRIGRHMEHFEKGHFALFDSLPQDFMHTLGYKKGSPNSSRMYAMRRRPLVVKRLSIEQLYTPLLVQESLFGWNIVEIKGVYYTVRQGECIASPAEAKSFARKHEGFITISDAVSAITIFTATEENLINFPQPTGNMLAIEGFLGFNVVQHLGCWYGFDQAAGPLDITSLDTLMIEAMRKKQLCVTGKNIADIKAEILNLAVQAQLKCINEQKKSVRTQEVEIDRRINELQSCIDVGQLQSITELKSFQDQLKTVKEQQESTHPNGLIVEGYFGFNIVHHQHCWYGFNQDTGPLDIGSLDARTIEAMKKSKQCLIGDSIAEIKADILSLTLHEQLGILREWQETSNANGAGIDRRLDELLVSIDAIQSQLVTEIKFTQERLFEIKELVEGISHNPLVRVSNQMANLSNLDIPNNE